MAAVDAALDALSEKLLAPLTYMQAPCAWVQVKCEAELAACKTLAIHFHFFYPCAASLFKLCNYVDPHTVLSLILQPNLGRNKLIDPEIETPCSGP